MQNHMIEAAALNHHQFVISADTFERLQQALQLHKLMQSADTRLYLDPTAHTACCAKFIVALLSPALQCVQPCGLTANCV